jgi:hypothetical protein
MLYLRNARAYAKGDHRAWDGPKYEAEMARWRAEIEREAAERTAEDARRPLDPQ